MSSYTAEERATIIAALGANDVPICPRCSAAVAILRSSGHDQVSYVRRRVVVRCAHCRLSVGVESREIEG